MDDKTIGISLNKDLMIMWTKFMSFRHQYKWHEKADCEKRKGHKQRKFSERVKCCGYAITLPVSITKVSW